MARVLARPRSGAGIRAFELEKEKCVAVFGRRRRRRGASSPAFALDKVTFGTNWLAEAEHGGYYQAVVDGTYAKYGLDVTILPGGPQANNGLLLAAGKIDFYMGGNMILGFRAVEQNLPIVVVAARFPERPADHDVASRRRPRQMDRFAEGDRFRRQGRRWSLSMPG